MLPSPSSVWSIHEVRSFETRCGHSRPPLLLPQPMVAVGSRLPSAWHVSTSGGDDGRPKAHDVHDFGQTSRASPSLLRCGTLFSPKVHAPQLAHKYVYTSCVKSNGYQHCQGLEAQKRSQQHMSSIEFKVKQNTFPETLNYGKSSSLSNT